MVSPATVPHTLLFNCTAFWIASLSCTHLICFYYTFTMEDKTKAQPVWIRTKWDLVVCGKVWNPLSQAKEPSMNHRQAARPGDAGEQSQQFGISDSQPSLAQAKMPLRNLPRRSEVSEHQKLMLWLYKCFVWLNNSIYCSCKHQIIWNDAVSPQKAFMLCLGKALLTYSFPCAEGELKARDSFQMRLCIPPCQEWSIGFWWESVGEVWKQQYPE